jgi:hypothetical protein
MSMGYPQINPQFLYEELEFFREMSDNRLITIAGYREGSVLHVNTRFYLFSSKFITLIVNKI